MVNTLMNKNLKVGLITILLLTLFFSTIYLWTITGKPYKYSEEYIKKDKKVIAAIGEIKNLHLSFFGKYYVTSNGADGWAEYKIIVKGNKGKGIVYITLRQKAGIWKLTQGKLVCADGKVISLGGQEIEG